MKKYLYIIPVIAVIILAVFIGYHNKPIIKDGILIGDAGGPSLTGASTTYASTVASSSFTFTHTVPSTGSNRGLVVVLFCDSGNNTCVDSVKWGGSGGTSMTKIVNVAGGVVGGGIMYFLAAPTASTDSVYVHITSGTANINAVAFNLQDVNQSSPIDATAANVNGTGSSGTQSVTTSANKSLVIAWNLLQVGTVTNIAPGAGQTGISSLKGVGDARFLNISYIQKASAGAQSTSYTWTTSSGYDYFVTSLKYEGPAASSITLTDINNYKIVQRETNNTGTTTISGTYTGTPTTIEARVTNDGGSTVVKDWSTISSSPTGGTFSGDIGQIAQGGWYNVQVRFSDNSATASGTNKFGVGMLVGVTGQSQAVNWFYNATGLTASSTTAVFRGGTTWVTTTMSSGAIAFSNKIHNALGNVPVGFIDAGINGSVISSWDETTDANFINFIASSTAIGGKLEYVVWNQGESDANAGTAEATYKTALGNVITNMRASTTRNRVGSLPFLTTVLGNLTSYATDAQQQAIRNAETDGCLVANTCYIAAQMIDATTTDGIHWDDAGYQLNGNRMAQTVLFILGNQSYYRGPYITSYIASTTSTFQINLTQNGGNDFAPTTSITGFTILDDASPETITSAIRVNANIIKLTISGTISGTPTVRYLYGYTNNSANVFDNSAMVLPMEFNRNIPVYTAPTVTVYPTVIFK